jgi:hypothetical protein
VNARVLVELPVGERDALLVPAAAVSSRFGLDYVQVAEGEATVDRAVVIGERIEHDGVPMVEIVTGLTTGDMVVTP